MVKKKSNIKKTNSSKSNKESDQIDLNLGPIVSFVKQKKTVIIPVILIIIAIFFSTWFRMYPAYLPATDNWAKSSVDTYYKSQIQTQIDTQYPNLPQANKNILIDEQFKSYVDQNKLIIDQQIESTSKQFKTQLQYTGENGKEYTYLLAIDPYLWYGYGKNYIECGHSGCDKKEDGKYYTFRNGRDGRVKNMGFISYFGVLLNKIANIFGNTPLMHSFFIIPVVMIGVSIIPAFLIARKFGGNIAGFFAGMFVALNSALLGRTPAGFSDNDAGSILFPLLIMWLFLEAVEAKSIKKSSVYSIFGAITFYLFSIIWKPHHMFDFLIIALVMYAGYLIFIDYLKESTFDFKRMFQKIKEPMLKGSIFLGLSLILLVYSLSFKFITKLVTRVIEFAVMKDVGITTIWPNVLTTVAEFNEAPFSSIVGQMGGTLIFAFAIIGMILAFFKKDEAGNRYFLAWILLLVMLLATGYSYTKGIRFALLLVPAFSIAFGASIGIIINSVSEWLAKEFEIKKSWITPLFIVGALLIIGITPNPVSATGIPFCNAGMCLKAHNVAMNEIPSYNDAWDATLTKIKDNATDGVGYITTWWDFGHWFVAHDVRVTFDGGDQGERIHWVGKSLLASEEKISTGILRMLNCGQEQAPHILENHFGGDTLRAINVLDEIFVLNKVQAKTKLKAEGLNDNQIDEVLEKTHCDVLLPQYYITSEDMVGKSGVWAHFGAWDFERAKMWSEVHDKEMLEGISILKTDFGLNEAQAQKIYFEITSTNGDRWIAPWPSYTGGKSRCVEDEKIIQCENGVKVNKTSYDAWIDTAQGKKNPRTFVYNIDKEFKSIKYTENILEISEGRDLGIGLIYENNRPYSIMMDDELSESIFTKLFFYNGIGTTQFEKFDDRQDMTGLQIVTWTVDLD